MDAALPKILLDRSGVRRLASGHPWIFADQVADGADVAPGLVALEGPPGRARGFAVANPDSRIAVRVVSRDPAFDPSPAWWRARLDRAIARRDAPACRWVHAEADGLPGLVVDRYGDVAVVQAGCRWADDVAPLVARHLLDAHGLRGVLARHDGAFRRPERLTEEVRTLAGDVPPEVDVRVGALELRVDPWHGQKTGTFLDQRENQRDAPDLLPDGRCLDVFSGDGGFALHLAVAGREVETIESSEPARARAAANAERQGLVARVRAQDGNAFERLRERAAAGERYDGVVLDPPALAKRRADRAAALRGYKELNLRALKLLAPGGRLFTCTCSHAIDRATFLGTLASAAADAGREVVVRASRGAASCHPHRLGFPESAYLKAFLLEVRS